MKDIYYKTFSTVDELSMFFMENPQHEVINIETVDGMFRAWFNSGDNIKELEQDWLDKSCEWLKDCLPNIEYITNASARRQNKEKFIESYRKYMEK